MDGGDELYTIEIHFGGGAPKKTAGAIPPPGERPSGERPPGAPRDKTAGNSAFAGSPPAPENKTGAVGEKKISGEDKAPRDAKRQEFLRLRDAIFNKNRGPVHNSFLEAARRYANEAPGYANPVSFFCYWPTYDVMTKPQLDWYFYWRKLVRNGEYPHVTQSYIYVYIYELINGVGADDGGDGLDKLCALWGAYRKLYGALDRNLTAWVSDYIAIHFPEGVPESVLAKIADEEILRMLPEGVITDSLFDAGEKGAHAGDILTYIFKYSSYHPEKSKFYREGDQAFIRSYLAGACMCLNDALKRKTGKGIFAAFIPANPQKRMPYANAIYQGDVKSVVCPWQGLAVNKPLKDFLGAFLKAVENALRSLTRYRGRLKSNISPEYALLAEKYVTEREKRERAESRAREFTRIDKSKVQDIMDGADRIREKLLSGAKTEDVSPFGEGPVRAAAKTEINPETPKQALFTHPNAEFWGSLTPIRRDILAYLNEHGGAAALADIEKRFQACFAETEIDGINEAAIDFLGDILIIDEGEKLKIQEI